MPKGTKLGPSMSKSALLLSPCLAWAHPKAKWYDEKHTDTSARDLGTEFHRLIDSYLKGDFERKELTEAVASSNGLSEPDAPPKV